MTARQDGDDASTLIRRFDDRRRQAHALLVKRFGDEVSSPFLLKLPSSSALDDQWSFQKHGYGVRLTNAEGEVIELLRIDRYQDGELVPSELIEFLASIDVWAVHIADEVIPVNSEASVKAVLQMLSRRGDVRCNDKGSFLLDRSS